MNRAIDTIVFDLDGTLLDTLPDLVVLTNAALAEQGFPTRTPEEINSFVGKGVRHLVVQAVPENTPEEVIDVVMVRWKELLPELGINLTEPYPLVLETLAALKSKGIKLGVLSNKFDKGVQEAVGIFLPNIFDVVYGETPEIPCKPNPIGLQRVIKELGSTAEKTAYVGDSAGDMIVATRTGALSVGVSWGYHSAEELQDAGADMVIESMKDLLLVV